MISSKLRRRSSVAVAGFRGGSACATDPKKTVSTRASTDTRRGITHSFESPSPFCVRGQQPPCHRARVSAPSRREPGDVSFRWQPPCTDRRREQHVTAQPRPLPGGDRPAPARRIGRLLHFPRQGFRLRRPGRRTSIALIALAVIVALVVAASFFVDAPMRKTIEHQMNQSLKGYTAHIARLSFHPLGLSVTLYGLTFAQNAHPDPPVLEVRRLDASVQWKALLHLAIVANFRLENPKLYADIQHIRDEAKDPTPLDKHGWQEAFEKIYPLKINQLVIANGEAVYVDPGPFKPLRLSSIQVHADNIRNVHSRDRTSPSSLALRAVERRRVVAI